MFSRQQLSDALGTLLPAPPVLGAHCVEGHDGGKAHCPPATLSLHLPSLALTLSSFFRSSATPFGRT